jgi:hypothetical protein
MAIKILKEGEEGFGMMIEQDAGSIDAHWGRNKKLIAEQSVNGRLDLTKPIYIYATLQKYGVENRNGRIYPEAILKKQVELYQEVIKRNASFHELDHPESSVISLKGGSPHRIVELFWEGNALIGKLEILVSRGYRESGIISCDGDLVAHYLDYGMTLGISSRGIGTLKKVNGKNVVQSDFELVCWDIVSSPSTPGSYLYWNKEDMQAYDEVLPGAEANPMASASAPASASGGDDIMSRLNKFLNMGK